MVVLLVFYCINKSIVTCQKSHFDMNAPYRPRHQSSQSETQRPTGVQQASLIQSQATALVLCNYTSLSGSRAPAEHMQCCLAAPLSTCKGLTLLLWSALETYAGGERERAVSEGKPGAPAVIERSSSVTGPSCVGRLLNPRLSWLLGH